MSEDDEPGDPGDYERLAVREEGLEGGVLELLHPRTSGPRLYGSRAESGTRPPPPTIVGA